VLEFQKVNGWNESKEISEEGQHQWLENRALNQDRNASC
jgi:hypothetical protein